MDGRVDVFRLAPYIKSYVSVALLLMPEMAEAMTEKEPIDAQADG